MPAFNAYSYIMDAIEADIREVWPQVAKIYRQAPATVVAKSKAYATISMQPDSPLGLGERDGLARIQTARFVITKCEPLPLNKTDIVLDLIVSDSNALVERLERDHRYGAMVSGEYAAQDTWANLGDLETDAKGEKVYLVNVEFQVRVRELHTSKQGA